MNVRVLLSQSEKIELNGHPMPINTGNVFGRNWNLFWRQKYKKIKNTFSPTLQSFDFYMTRQELY